MALPLLALGGGAAAAGGGAAAAGGGAALAGGTVARAGLMGRMGSAGMPAMTGFNAGSALSGGGGAPPAPDNTAETLGAYNAMLNPYQFG